jgi:hypothetical protein
MLGNFSQSITFPDLPALTGPATEVRKYLVQFR